MLIFLLSALIVWNGVLTFFVLRDWRLLLRVVRWSASIWLVGFGVLASEVLREGLLVNGDVSLHWDVRLAWTAWFVLIACSVLDWRLLVPAAALSLWFLSYPEVHILLNYGLVRLHWLRVVYSPLTWAATRPGIFAWGIRVHKMADCFLHGVVLPVLGSVRILMDYTAGWVSWTTDQNLDKLRPSPRWTWLPFAWGW